MPLIDDFKCNKCDLSFPTGWGGYMYVIDDSGKRIHCLHPVEDHFVDAVLGKNASKELIAERTGFNSHCICQSCLQQFELDIGDDEKAKSWRYYYPIMGFGGIIRRDERKCPYCNSYDVKTVLELVGQTCPKCKEGVIEKVWTGGIT